jgi:hypothetical protein
VLDDSILERMKRDHDDACTGLQAVRYRFEKVVDALEFAVHPDAKCLKSTRRRIDACEAPVRHGSPDDCGKLPGAPERRRLTRLYDRACDPPRETLFAEPVNRVGDLGLRSISEKVPRGRTACRIHAHVERILALETEASPLRFELIRRHAHVGERAVDLLDAAGVEHRCDRPVVGVHQVDTTGERPQCLRSDRKRRGIPIETYHPRGARFEHCQRVAPHPDCAVHEDAAFLRLQELQHFARQDRLMQPHMKYASESEGGERPAVFVCERFALQLRDGPLVVPNFEIVVLAEHVYFADHRRRLTEPRGYHHAPLGVDLGDLTVEIHPIEELQT